MKCKKKCYPTRKVAKKWAKRAKTGKRISTYHCQTCGAWHLTSYDARARHFIRKVRHG